MRMEKIARHLLGHYQQSEYRIWHLFYIELRHGNCGVCVFVELEADHAWVNELRDSQIS